MNKMLAVVGVVVLVLVAVVVGAVLTGFIVVGEPGAAVSQVLSGDFREPDVGVEEMTLGPLGAPEGRFYLKRASTFIALAGMEAVPIAFRKIQFPLASTLFKNRRNE